MSRLVDMPFLPKAYSMNPGVMVNPEKSSPSASAVVAQLRRNRGSTASNRAVSGSGRYQSPSACSAVNPVSLSTFQFDAVGRRPGRPVIEMGFVEGGVDRKAAVVGKI